MMLLGWLRECYHIFIIIIVTVLVLFIIIPLPLKVGRFRRRQHLNIILIVVINFILLFTIIISTIYISNCSIDSIRLSNWLNKIPSTIVFFLWLQQKFYNFIKKLRQTQQSGKTAENKTTVKRNFHDIYNKLNQITKGNFLFLMF